MSKLIIKIISVFLFSTFVMTFIISCSTISSGKKYTLAKMDREKHLIEPNKVIDVQNTLDYLDIINPTNAFRVVLNSGYFPYLQEVGRPEVAIFITAKMNSNTEPDASLIWERVYLNSEAEGTHLVINKDSFLPRKDITILPSILYTGQEITISIRVIEMDQEDNARMQELVAVAAAAASTFQPQYAGAISIFQNVLNYIISNNADDIEFQYDFLLSQSLNPVHYKKTKTVAGAKKVNNFNAFDMVLNPRIGTYAVIKTEHRKRPIIPYGYADFAQNGLRYGLAEILKFGSLGILNWPTWCYYTSLCNHMDIKEQDDLYHRILGRPFAPVHDSFIPPAYNKKGLLESKGDQDGIFKIVGNNLKLEHINEDLDYEDQAYLLFSIVPDVTGIAVESLQKLKGLGDIVKQLNIRTGQLSSTDLKINLEPVLTAIEGYTAEIDIREQCTARINTAEKENIETVKIACTGLVNEIQGTSKSVQLAKKNAINDIESLAARRLKHLAKLEAESKKKLN